MNLTFRILSILCSLSVLTAQQATADSSPAQAFDGTQFNQWMSDNSNWGRWGKMMS